MQMKTLIIALATVLIWQSAGQAASRTWKSRKGLEVKAEFTGVLNGKVILKLAGGIRQPVRLSDFSLEDRDFLVDHLTKRNRQKEKQQLLELMAAENAVRVIDPDAVRPTNAEGTDSGYETPETGQGNPLAFNPINPNLPGQVPEVETEMYGLSLPSPELLVEDKVRTWTSLTGLKQLATFDRVLAPGFLRLKKADGTTGNFAIVNFVKEDIDYVKQVLQEDMARPVFPEGPGFQSLTPDDVAKGYRVWTDRKKVPLVGKFIAVKGKDVVIEVAGENKEYPKAGLSEADITWVNNEVRRRAEAARAQAEANRSSSEGYTGGSGSSFPSRPTFPRRPSFGTGGHGDSGYADAGGHGEDGSTRGRFGTGSMFQYKHTCQHCGKSWTDSSALTECPDCKGKKFYKCMRCGHKWSQTSGGYLEKCPKCSSQIGNDRGSGGIRGSDSGQSGTDSYTSSPPSSGTAAATKEGSGVLTTIVYVALGLSVLGGIVGGLFRAFG